MRGRIVEGDQVDHTVLGTSKSITLGYNNTALHHSKTERH